MGAVALDESVFVSLNPYLVMFVLYFSFSLSSSFSAAAAAVTAVGSRCHQALMSWLLTTANSTGSRVLAI